MNVALHSALPRIEAAYQYYTDREEKKVRELQSEEGRCESWVDWYGKVVCDGETLEKLIGVEEIEGAHTQEDAENRCVII